MVCGPVQAHVGALQTRTPFVDATGAILGAGTTWGITLVENDVAIRTCDEANAGITQWTAKVPEGVLVATTTGLYRTENGCRSTLLGFADEIPHLVAQSDVASTLLIATTDGTTARVYRTDDAAETLSPVFSSTDVTLLSVEISRDGTAAVIAGYEDDLTPAIFYLDTQGVRPLDIAFGESPAFVNVVGTDDVEGTSQFALSLISPSQSSRLVLVDAAAAVGGAQDVFTLVASFDDVVTHYAATAQGRAVVLDRRAFFSQIQDGDFKPESTGPSRCVRRAPGRDAMIGCGTDESGAAVGTSDDGRTWTWTISFSDIEDRLCPAGTVGRIQCAYLFPGLDAGTIDVDGGPDDAGSRDGGGEEDAGRQDGGPSDGGLVLDAGAADAGEARDAGPPPADAGEPADGGTVDGGSVDAVPDCGCSSSQDASAPGAALAGLAGLLTVFGGRRRRSHARG